MVTAALIVATAVAAILYTVGVKLYKFYQFRKRVNKIPGPKYAIPFVGMMYDYIRTPKEERLQWFQRIADQYEDGFFRTWITSTANVHVRKPEYVEVILRSNTEIRKSTVYEYLHLWLGNGLITSTGSQWFHDRKLLTPAFHFSILEIFAEVMIEKAAKLNHCVERQIKVNGDKPFDVFELGGNCALDIICETAMGTNINAQENPESEYICAIYAITTSALNRFFRPWLKSDWMFYRSALGKSFKAAVNIANDICDRVIATKQTKRKFDVAVSDVSEEGEAIDKPKRKAFLDLLLEANEKEDNRLTMQDVRDQINTFMFAGHDTTGALFGWAVFCLGNAPDVQKKVHEELDDILGDSDDHTTLKRLSNLKYLERVIKEVLRLYPSVPSISRKLLKDLQIGNYVLPADVILSIQIYQLHRDPTIWPNPLHFDPDRFLPENVKTRHPYAYIPFSAGPRNCIGQKYAMLESKILLAKLLRNFSIKSIETHSTIKMSSDIVLRPTNGIYVKMMRRAVGTKRGE